MLFRQMQYFQAVVETSSFTAAAERCNISQSAISQQIQALEAELGVQLLARHGRKFDLTPAGKLFYQRSVVLTADFEQLRRDTIRAARGDAGTLNFGYLISYSGDELNRVIGAFSELYPEITLQVSAGNHEELFDGLRMGQLDLVLNDQRRVFSEEYVNRILAESECCIEIAAHNPLSRLDGIEIADLKHLPCILIASVEQHDHERSYYRDVIGFHGEFLFAWSIQEARAMVAANRGVMPVEVYSNNDSANSAIRRIPLLRGGSPISRNLCVFRKKENDAPALKVLEQMLAEQFESGKACPDASESGS